MFLLVGLGNPGAKYAKNRHNIGFMAVDEIARQYNFGAERSRLQGLAREGVIETETGPQKIILVKPQTKDNMIFSLSLREASCQMIGSITM